MTLVATATGTQGSVIATSCQICGSDKLESVLFLGYHPPVNQMRTIGHRPEGQLSFPAELLHCRSCDLVQLGCVVDPVILFPPGYPYTSGTTRILRDNFANLYTRCREILDLKENDLIIDIGSNDGTLLSNFKGGGHRVLGIEPTDVGQIARERGIATLQRYMSGAVGRDVRGEYGPARVVTAANVFAHIEDPHNVVEGIVAMMAPDGIFVSENHYLPALIDTLQYDTIYHEHLRYYSLTSITPLLQKHGLEVFQAERIPTHGGSIRVYSAPVGSRQIDASVEQIKNAEPKGDDLAKALKKFRDRVRDSKLELLTILGSLKKQGKTICAISAPSRASTLVNFVGLDDMTIDYVCEVNNSLKIGKYLPGTLIPVVDESRMFETQPDAALILSWHIADELMPKLRARGYRGSFIVPLPEPRLITA